MLMQYKKEKIKKSSNNLFLINYSPFIKNLIYCAANILYKWLNIKLNALR